MKKCYIFSRYPSKTNPTYYYFMRHRVDSIKKYYDVTVITINYTSEYFDSKVKYKKMDGYKLITFNIKKINVPKFHLLYKEYQIDNLLKDILNESPPDLIDAHFSSFYSWLVYKNSKKLKIPFVITEHASFFEDRIEHFYFGPKIKKALIKADAVVCVSPFLKNTMKKYITRKINVIPNVINVKKFNKMENIEENGIRIITVGNLDKTDKKGFELLIKSLNLVKQDGYDFICNIIGQGPNKYYLEELIKNYELTNEVKLLGTVENDLLPYYYNNSTFFVSSSKIETFGVAIVEAMSCGLPIVSTKSGGPENFISKEVGLLSELSVKDLSRNIVKMIKTHENYEPDIIRSKVIEKFSEEAYCKQIIGLYDKLVK